MDFYTLQLRQGANEGFQRWLGKRIEILICSLDHVLIPRLWQHLLKLHFKHYTGQGTFAKQKAHEFRSDLERFFRRCAGLKRWEIGGEITKRIHCEFNMWYEVNLWRRSAKVCEQLSQLKSLEQFRDLHGHSSRDSAEVEAIRRLKADCLQERLLEYAKSIRHRLQWREQNYYVMPLVDTFDLLHLQEVHLRTRKINRSTRLKNRQKNIVNLERRGGKQKKKAEKKLLELG